MPEGRGNFGRRYIGIRYSIEILFMWNHSIKFKKSSRRSLPLDTSFSIWGRFFPPSIKIKYVIASLVVSSLKLLEDHLCSKDFA
jgi:uncharacterized protein (UPF0303 family)